jgi:hypothetical protein
MLTDGQLEQLCIKMNIPLASNGIKFKDEFRAKDLEYNKSYIVNLDDEYDDKGRLNSGSHWTCFQIVKYNNGNVAPMYFDPFGAGPPEDVKEQVMKFCKKKIPYNTKDIQSMMANACGFYCCAYLHYINNFSHRCGDVYDDTEQFLSYFDDLNKSSDFMKNEFILKQFFSSEDPSKRGKITSLIDTGTTIDPENITNDRNGNGIVPFDE